MLGFSLQLSNTLTQLVQQVDLRQQGGLVQITIAQIQLGVDAGAMAVDGSGSERDFHRRVAV